MSWSNPANHVYVVGELVTPATMNTYIKDNLIDLDRRASFKGNAIEPQESVTATTYVDMATVGPTVSIDVGQTGDMLVHLYASLANNNAGNAVFMSYEISGATVRGASDIKAIAFTPSVNFGGARFGASIHEPGLTPGVHTIRAKYRVSGGTGQLSNRRIMVVPFGS